MELKFKKNKIKNKKHKQNDTLKNEFDKNSTVSNPVNVLDKSGAQVISGYFLNEKSYKEMVFQRGRPGG